MSKSKKRKKSKAKKSKAKRAAPARRISSAFTGGISDVAMPSRATARNARK
jgi:hypothetical protein